jgi:hypothetical protein
MTAAAPADRAAGGAAFAAEEPLPAKRHPPPGAGRAENAIKEEPMHRTRVSLLIALAAAVAAVLPAQALEQRTFHHSFDLASGQTLRLANLAGSVELVAGDSGRVEVEVTAYAEDPSLLNALDWVDSTDAKGRAEKALSYPVERYGSFHYPGDGDDGEPSFWERLFRNFNLSQTTTSYRGRRVKITGRPSGSSPTLYANLVISVPPAGELAVRNAVGEVRGRGELSGQLEVGTGSGHVTLEGFEGELAVATGSGSVDLGRLRGEIAASTGSGRIEVRQLVGNGRLTTGSGSVELGSVAAGRLNLTTGSGSIQVRDGSAGELVAETGSGSIRVEQVEVESLSASTGSGGVTLESSLAGTREVEISTGSGGVEILAGPDASFDLTASVPGGSLHCRYRDAELRRKGDKVVGAMRGDGATRIRVSTGSGGCTIGPA